MLSDTTSTTWGCELWDRHDAVVEETARDVSKLAYYYARSANIKQGFRNLQVFEGERGGGEGVCQGTAKAGHQVHNLVTA